MKGHERRDVWLRTFPAEPTAIDRTAILAITESAEPVFIILNMETVARSLRRIKGRE